MRTLLLCLSAALSLHCGDDDFSFDAGSDAGSDAALDAPSSRDIGPQDAGEDAGEDAATLDAGQDASPLRDVGVDVPVDVGTDTLPPCEGEDLRCGEACVDPEQDILHCGGCGLECGESEVCMAAECVHLRSWSDETFYDPEGNLTGQVVVRINDAGDKIIVYEEGWDLRARYYSAARDTWTNSQIENLPYFPSAVGARLHEDGRVFVHWRQYRGRDIGYQQHAAVYDPPMGTWSAAFAASGPVESRSLADGVVTPSGAVFFFYEADDGLRWARRDAGAIEWTEGFLREGSNPTALGAMTQGENVVLVVSESRDVRRYFYDAVTDGWSETQQSFDVLALGRVAFNASGQAAVLSRAEATTHRVVRFNADGSAAPPALAPLGPSGRNVENFSLREDGTAEILYEDRNPDEESPRFCEPTVLRHEVPWAATSGTETGFPVDRGDDYWRTEVYSDTYRFVCFGVFLQSIHEDNGRSHILVFKPAALVGETIDEVSNYAWRSFGAVSLRLDASGLPASDEQVSGPHVDAEVSYATHVSPNGNAIAAWTEDVFGGGTIQFHVFE